MRKNKADPRAPFHNTSAANPDPGSGAFLAQGSGIEKSRIRDEHPVIFPRAWKHFFGLKILECFDADPGPF
jgi:hypothetical protein